MVNRRVIRALKNATFVILPIIRAQRHYNRPSIKEFQNLLISQIVEVVQSVTDKGIITTATYSRIGWRVIREFCF